MKETVAPYRSESSYTAKVTPSDNDEISDEQALADVWASQVREPPDLLNSVLVAA